MKIYEARFTKEFMLAYKNSFLKVSHN